MLDGVKARGHDVKSRTVLEEQIRLFLALRENAAMREFF